MRWWAIAATMALVLGCVPTGGGGGSGGDGGDGGGGGEAGGAGGEAGGGPGPTPGAPSLIGEATPESAAYATALGALARLAESDGFDAAAMGDPAVYIPSDATTPSAPMVFASVYYESGDLAETIEGASDRRPGLERDDDAGPRIASAVARAIQLGAVSEGPADMRNGARWQALLAARTLDGFAPIYGWRALAERSADGYDRFVALLWDAGGRPHGVGARLAAIDATCGTDSLSTIAQTLSGVRAPFIAALDELGQLDPLDRRVIEEGDSPEYDAAIATALEALEQGIAVGLLAALTSPMTGAGQAETLGSLAAIQARLRAADAGAYDTLNATLDDMDPSAIDPAAVRATLSDALGVPRCE